ncbi:MAG: ArdC-like ssDNA-binding domain-containing protein, partial [Bradyrhizobium sp.]
DLGGHVRKGERGTKVYFVKQLQVRDQRADDSSEIRLIPMMREYTVFNLDQCESLSESINTGKPVRVRNPDTRDELADAFLHSTGADIREGMCRAEISSPCLHSRRSRARWWPRLRGCSPVGSPTGPFATSYGAYRHAMNTPVPIS